MQAPAAPPPSSPARVKTMSAERTCEGCRWFDEGMCRAGMHLYAIIERDSNAGYACGPSGRYWEPREGKPCTP